MFVVRRFEWIPGEETVDTVVARSPLDQQFPGPSTWRGTYDYHDEDSNEYVVYTTPSFYAGNIGVVLTNEGKLATDRPLVQIKRRWFSRDWELPSEDRSFFLHPGTSPNDPQSWGLRYGGTNEGRYVFEIINTTESTVTQVLQTISVSEAKFLDGVTIREVMLKGIAPDQQGTIKYETTDLWSKGRQR
tara:strand:+ start:4335 stop:4898 length:564 start_codon:yes stop_codon:yes gene_type:complete